MNDFSLDGMTALVTGGGRGLGKSISIGLARAGADVVPVSRTVKNNREVVASITAAGRKSLELAVDVTCRKQLEEMLQTVIDQFGKIDILVNCAGVHVKKPLLELEDAEWDRVIDTNLRAVYLTCSIIGREMVSQGNGRIVNIASLGALTGISNASAYCASKGGLAMLTRVLALEWADKGVTVNAVAPGFFDTDMTRPIFQNEETLNRTLSRVPMKRLGSADEIAGAVIYLSSHAARYVTGTVMVVDGGVTAGVT